MRARISILAVLVITILCLAVPAFAFWGPMEATTNLQTSSGGSYGTYYRVSYSVSDPVRGTQTGYWPSSINWCDHNYGGGNIGRTVYSPKTNGGMVTWLVKIDPSSASYNNDVYEVHYAAYDPLIGQWRAGFYTLSRTNNSLELRDIPNSNLTVSGGVVSWRTLEINSTLATGSRVHKFHYYTYDPSQQSWRSGNSSYYLPYTDQTTPTFLSSNGVVAWVNAQASPKTVNYTIYNPVSHQWVTGSTPSSTISNLTILSGGTVQWNSGTYQRGYDQSTGNWSTLNAQTKPFAYFLTSPSVTEGNPPLGIWFVDMSVGGISRSWNFGDGATSSSRSLYKVYSSVGYYTATQTVTGAVAPNSVATKIVKTDFAAPTNPQISINGGAATTTTPDVNLTLSATDNSGLVAQMMISNNISFSGGDWEPYATSKAWTLPSGDGTKSVYAKFCDAAGNVSSTCYGSIILDASPLTCTITGPASPTSNNPINFIITFSKSVSGLTAGEINVTNGTKGALSGSGATYTLPVTPSAQGAVTCQVPAGAAQDTDGNNNTISNNLSITYNATDLTSTIITVANRTGAPEQTVTLWARLTTSTGSPISGKTLNFQVWFATAGSATTNTDGVATLAFTIPSDWTLSCNIKATFAGDTSYESSLGTGLLTIPQTLTDTTITMHDISGITPGQTISINATLTEIGGTPLGNRQINFKLGSTYIGSALTHWSSGVATLNYAVPMDKVPGSYTIYGTFLGDYDHNGFVGDCTLTLGKIGTRILVPDVSATPGQSVTLSADLANDSLPQYKISGKTINFQVDHVSVGTGITDSNGVATLAYTASTIIDSYTVTASFDGDATFIGSSGSGEIHVAPDTTAPAVLSINRYSPLGWTINPTSSLVWRVVFSEPVSNVDIGDFEITKISGDISGYSVSSVSSSSGQAINVTVAAGTGNGEIRLDLKAETDVQDAAGNLCPAYSTGQTYIIDNSVRNLTDVLMNMGNASFMDVQREAARQAEALPRYASRPAQLPEYQTFAGYITPASFVSLAIFSDDGADVYINGQLVHNRLNVGQPLPELYESLHVLPIGLAPSRTYHIEIRYCNLMYGGPWDIDGCTLFLYQGL